MLQKYCWSWHRTVMHFLMLTNWNLLWSVTGTDNAEDLDHSRLIKWKEWNYSHVQYLLQLPMLHWKKDQTSMLYMYMYVYIYILYIHIYTHTHIYIYIYIYIYMYTHTHTHTHTYTYTYTHIYSISQKWVHPSHFGNHFSISFQGTIL